MSTGTTVPHLPCVELLDKVRDHYSPYKHLLTWGERGFVVRLPEQKRIHFYNYDYEVGPGHLHTFPFTSEGFYDEQSPYWLPF